MTETAVITARLSVQSSEESVAIDRQLKAGRDYCAARGWEVVEEFVDDGVSASKVAPWLRPRLGKALTLPEHYDHLVAWSLDRITRSLSDFVSLDERLQARGAAVCTVKESIDMSTDMGRLIAQILAIFAEFEAKQIGSRVKAAREFIIKAGRSAGGRPTYGYMLADNPDGPGRVVVQDPERLSYVIEAVYKFLAGESTYQIARWLDDSGAPLRGHKQRSRSWWSESSVDALLRNPVLAGLTKFEPGRQPGEKGDPSAVLRDAEGMPIIREDLAIISTDDRREIVQRLDTRSTHWKPRSTDSSSLLSQMLTCGTCGHYLHKANSGNNKHGNRRIVYRCSYRTCEAKAGGGSDVLRAYVTERFLAEWGSQQIIEVEQTQQDGVEALEAIQHRVRDITEAMAQPRADRLALVAKLDQLDTDRERLESESGMDSYRYVISEDTVAERWASLEGDELGQRDLLREYTEKITVSPGRRGGSAPQTERIQIDFKPGPKGFAPQGPGWQRPREPGQSRST
jgi:site-specific DNA recombinase